jgi:hypothetical protein
VKGKKELLEDDKEKKDVSKNSVLIKEKNEE